MKKIKIIGIITSFILSFILHSLYNIIPNFFTSIISPINESIWEHMKLIVTSNLIFGIIESFIYKRKNITYHNLILSYAISSIIGVIFYLIIYIPIDKIFDHNLIMAIIILLITFIIIAIINYYLMNYKEIKYNNVIGIILIISIYVIFGYLTYNPPNTSLFYDYTQ